jgi:hypothetical protein
MCRTHTTQHELSAIAPNFQWEQLLASLGFSDIGATNPEVAASLEVAHTRTRARIPNCGPFWESSPAPPFATTASNTPGMTLAAARGPT